MDARLDRFASPPEDLDLREAPDAPASSGAPGPESPGFEAEPPDVEAPREHPLWPAMVEALRTVYDPEIPVNIYELGLIYKVEIGAANDARIEMTLTAPGCPVAGEMPGMVQDALTAVDGLGPVEVELVWQPSWTPEKMADTAKLELGFL